MRHCVGAREHNPRASKKKILRPLVSAYLRTYETHVLKQAVSRRPLRIRVTPFRTLRDSALLLACRYAYCYTCMYLHTYVCRYAYCYMCVSHILLTCFLLHSLRDSVLLLACRYAYCYICMYLHAYVCRNAYCYICVSHIRLTCLVPLLYVCPHTSCLQIRGGR